MDSGNCDEAFARGYHQAGKDLDRAWRNAGLDPAVIEPVCRPLWLRPVRWHVWDATQSLWWPQGWHEESPPTEQDLTKYRRQETRQRLHYMWLDEVWRPWYQRYLSSELWRRRREFIMLRANHVCEMCHDRAATNVHHITYDHVGHEYPEHLLAVCDGCHAKAHGRDK